MLRLRRFIAIATAAVVMLALAGCPRGGDACAASTASSPSPCPTDDGGGNVGGY